MVQDRYGTYTAFIDELLILLIVSAIIDHLTYIVFNLSSINDAESIIASQIHVYRKYRHIELPTKEHRRHDIRAKQRLRGEEAAATHDKRSMSVPVTAAPSGTDPEVGNVHAEMTMNVFELAPSFVRKLAAFSISKSERSGWLSFDVTDIVGRQRNISFESIGGKQRLLAVRFAHEVYGLRH